MNTRHLLVALSLALIATSCGQGDEAEISGGVEELWGDAQSTMLVIQSYHMELIFPTQPEEFGIEVDYVAPDSYRLLLFSAEGETTKECEPGAEDGVFVGGEVCREVFTEITGRSVYEAIIVGDALYARECDDLEEGCEDWEQRERPPVVLAGPSPTFAPGWPLVALEQAEPVEVVGLEELDGTDLIHLHGRVNHLRAIFENERRIMTTAGITSFGTECTLETGLPGEPPREEVCRELTFEQSLERQALTLSFYDEQPAVIDIWIDPNSSFVHRIAIGAGPPPDEDDDDRIVIIIDYSRHNAMQIEAPE